MGRFVNFIKEYNFPIKVVNLAIVLLAWTWVYQTTKLSPSFTVELEPVITFLGSIIALGWLEIQGPTDRKVEIDRQIAQLFMQRLPSNGATISFLKDHHMGGAFENKHLSDLEEFLIEWSNPEHEFHNSELEQKKAVLINLARGFLRVAAINTWPTGVSELQMVPDEWIHEQPERWKQVVDDLNSYATEIVNTHQELIRLSRRALKM